MNNQNQINQNQIIDEKNYEIYISNKSEPGFDDLHYFNWCQQIAWKYWQPMQQCNQHNDWNGYQKNGRKWQDFFFDNGNGINFDGVNKVDLSVPIPANLNYTNIFREFYWSVCENMRLFANDVVYYLWLRIYKKHIASKLKSQKFNNISELKDGLDNAFKNNISWQNFIEKLKESRITFANIYDETHTQELFKLFDELNKSMPKEIQMFCKSIGKERFLLLLKSIYAKFLDFDGKEHDFQNDINSDDKTINKKILEARKQVKLCSALYKLFIKDKIEHWGLDNRKIAWLRNNDLLKYAQKPKDNLFYNDFVKMRTGWNNLKGKPLGKLNENIRNVTWMNYANWDSQDFDGINGRLPGYYDRNGNFVEGEWRWFSQQFDVMINYYDSDVNDLCDWIHPNNNPNRKLSMPLVGNANLGSSCYFNAANVSELGNPINLMFNFKLGRAILIQKDSKSNINLYGHSNFTNQIAYFDDDFFKLDTIYENIKTNADNDEKNKYNYNLSYIRYVRLVMDVHLFNIKSNSNQNIAIQPTNLRDSLRKANQQFSENKANDSVDLLRFNYEKKNELNAFNNGIIEPMRPDQTSSLVTKNNFLDFNFINDRSYICSSMYGVLPTLTTGEICKHQTYGAGFDVPYNAFNVVISDKKNFTRLQTKGKTPMLTLWELLNNFSSSEKLTGDNQFCCNQCPGETPGTFGKLVDATIENISYNIFEHKSHATLNVDRKKNKIDRANVAVPEIVKSGSNYFCLSSVIEHAGSSSILNGATAHFTCFLNCYADGWNFYNDSYITDQPNGFGDVFQNTYTSDNSRIGHVYQYTQIGPTEYLYLKNNETIAIPFKFSKNGKNNRFIHGAEAHCLRRAIKYFCQPNDDDTDIDIYESSENKIKSELERIVVYKYPNSEDKNKFTSVTLWDYFQDMDSSLIFPYIFQLYKRNWDTGNYYELNHEKLKPEDLADSYEYYLCCLLIGKWNNQNFQLNPIQQTVYDAINKRIPSLQINSIQMNNSLNTIKKEENIAPNMIQNSINNIEKNNLSNADRSNTNQMTNQINNISNIKNKNELEAPRVGKNENNKIKNQNINTDTMDKTKKEIKIGLNNTNHNDLIEQKNIVNKIDIAENKNKNEDNKPINEKIENKDLIKIQDMDNNVKIGDNGKINIDIKDKIQDNKNKLCKDDDIKERNKEVTQENIISTKQQNKIIVDEDNKNKISTSNIKINSNSNIIKPEKNFTSNEIQNEIMIQNDINNGFQVNNQNEIADNVVDVKNENKHKSKIFIQIKIQRETNEITNKSDSNSSNDIKPKDSNENENSKNRQKSELGLGNAEIEKNIKTEETDNKVTTKQANTNNEIHIFNSTLRRNKNIAKALIIIGIIFLIAAIIVLLCKIYLATIILSPIGFIAAAIGIILIIKYCLMETNSDLTKLGKNNNATLDEKTIVRYQRQNYLESEKIETKTNQISN